MDGGDLGERGRSLPRVDRQRHGAAHPHIVERLLLLVGRQEVDAVPVAGLHRDLVAQLLDQLIARRRRHAAELRGGAVGADGVDAHRLLGGEDGDEAVEVGLTLMVVVGIAHALDRLAGLVGDELERSRAQDVLLEPARILLQGLLLVDVGERIGQRRQEGPGGELQLEHHGLGIGALHRVDHHHVALARARHALGRMHDVLPARRHVGGRERRAVVELHALADLEGVGLAVVGGHRHLGAEIADEVRRRCRIVGIDGDQRAVERRRGMERGVGVFLVPVEARRRIGRNHVGERAAALDVLRGRRRRGQRSRHGNGKTGRQPSGSDLHVRLPVRTRLVSIG